MAETEGNRVRDACFKAGQYGTIQPEENTTSTVTDNSQQTAGLDRTDKVEDKYCCGCLPDVYATEIRVLFRLTWPIALTCAFTFIPSTIAVVFCGHLGTTELDALGLAVSLTYAFGTVFAFGMCTACDTYFSQYYGSINRHKLGVILQKGLLIVLLSSVPSVAIQLNTATILRLFGQSPDVCRIAGRYMLIAIPSTIATFMLFTLARFTQSQNIVIPNLLVGFGGNLVDALLHYLFIHVAKMGIDGSALAHCLTFCLMTLALAAYIRFSGILEDTWQGWSLEAFDDWGGLFKLGLLGALVLSVDSWCFEISIVLAGLLSDLDLAAQTVLFQLNGMAASALIGIGIAASVRVGNMLGAGNSKAAIRATRVAILVSVVIGFIAAALMFALKSQLPTIFTSDPKTIRLVSKVVQIVAARMFFATISFTIEGILRGCARQALDAAIVVSGHTVSLTIAVSLMFKTPLKLSGQWVGYGCGMVLEAALGFIVILTTDWDHQTQRAMKLTKSVVEEDDQLTSAKSLPDSSRDDVPLVSDKQHPQIQSEKLAEAPFSISRTILVKRVCLLLAAVIVLLIGVAARLFIHIDTDISDHWNSTDTTTMLTSIVSSI